MKLVIVFQTGILAQKLVLIHLVMVMVHIAQQNLVGSVYLRHLLSTSAKIRMVLTGELSIATLEPINRKATRQGKEIHRNAKVFQSNII